MCARRRRRITDITKGVLTNDPYLAMKIRGYSSYVIKDLEKEFNEYSFPYLYIFVEESTFQKIKTLTKTRLKSHETDLDESAIEDLLSDLKNARRSPEYFKDYMSILHSSEPELYRDILMTIFKSVEPKKLVEKSPF